MFVLDIALREADLFSAALVQRIGPEKISAFPGKEVQHETTSELCRDDH
jgi:hypothetical protein